MKKIKKVKGIKSLKAKPKSMNRDHGIE